MINFAGISCDGRGRGILPQSKDQDDVNDEYKNDERKEHGRERGTLLAIIHHLWVHHGARSAQNNPAFYMERESAETETRKRALRRTTVS